MHYNYVTQHWQSNVSSSTKHYVTPKINSGIISAHNLFRQCTQASYQLLLTSVSKGLDCTVDSVFTSIQYLALGLNSISSLIRTQTQILRWLSKLVLVLVSLLLLCCSFNTQALSASTKQVVNGSLPYLTFDNGVTKVTTTTDALLGITISDGTTKTTYTPANNTSTADKPIVLPKENQSFADIGMLVPTNTNSIAFSALIDVPNNYWGDDDGDGQGVNGITATGTLSVSITDRNNQAVSRDTVLSLCDKAPYKVQLTSTDASLTTQYGLPNSSNFSGSTATYYISPKAGPKVCYARPSVNNFFNDNLMDGPADIWDSTKGFLVQSTAPSSYNRNFPTTGTIDQHFDLLVEGIDAATLTWPAVTHGGITATMTLKPPVDSKFNPDGASSVRVTLTGPVATKSQWESDSPGRIDTLTLPQTFELVGYDSNHTAVIKYGFVLKQWFVIRGKRDSPANQSSWCRNLDDGYRMPQVKDLTNAVCSGKYSATFCQGVVSATPSSSNNLSKRNIGAGLFTEWGIMSDYRQISFWENPYTTSDSIDSQTFFVFPIGGSVRKLKEFISYVICVYP